MALNTDTDAKVCGTVLGRAEFPAPQPGHVYVVSVPCYYALRNDVIAVFKNARSMERFFKGSRLAQLRYQGRDTRIEEVRGWYIVTERRVEG